MASTLTRRWLAASTMLAPVVAAAATPSAGCDKTLTSGIYRMVDQSVNRTYRVFVPCTRRQSKFVVFPRIDNRAGRAGCSPRFRNARNGGRCDLRPRAHSQLHLSVVQEHRAQHVLMDAVPGR